MLISELYGICLATMVVTLSEDNTPIAISEEPIRMNSIAQQLYQPFLDCRGCGQNCGQRKPILSVTLDQPSVTKREMRQILAGCNLFNCY
jgi:hypothetical protein